MAAALAGCSTSPLASRDGTVAALTSKSKWNVTVNKDRQEAQAGEYYFEITPAADSYVIKTVNEKRIWPSNNKSDVFIYNPSKKLWKNVLGEKSDCDYHVTRRGESICESPLAKRIGKKYAEYEFSVVLAAINSISAEHVDSQIEAYKQAQKAALEEKIKQDKIKAIKDAEQAKLDAIEFKKNRPKRVKECHEYNKRRVEIAKEVQELRKSIEYKLSRGLELSLYESSFQHREATRMSNWGAGSVDKSDPGIARIVDCKNIK